MRRVKLTPTVEKVNGEEKRTENADVYIYDTSGLFGDENASVDLKKGLPRLREKWITDRNDVEQLPEISSEYGQMRRDDKSLDHLRFEHIALPLRARRQGAFPKCITPNRVLLRPKWNMSPFAKI